MKPAAFEYHAPDSLEEALGLLAELGDEAKPIAGGQSLTPMLALRLAYVDHLIDLRRVEELRGTDRRDHGLWLGATTTQSTVLRSADVAAVAPLLARATPLIGHFQIRNRGTLGGSIAHGDAAAEYPAVAVALRARLEVAKRGGSRTVAADEFFTGFLSTALEPDELLTGVHVPSWGARSGFAIEEFARRHGDFAIAGAAVAVALDEDARISRCGIGLFGVGATPVRAAEIEAELVGAAVKEVNTAEVGRAALSGLESVPSDLHGSAAYRVRVGAALVDRALQNALREASHA
ncbi:FAD binding domain-containing protein [Cryptosporangium aurantiacum]|uniref:Carbon-monoxide dehydrogenase medium subunit n=1 Tax=Cryptosporangium aurantiacum TaxID=134849 RepID=A0A1M7RAP4_9ACTN|nr:FAD binding domain-containing protein [Cryptosporangium aurantiacum]SHN43333.1 carbon-monoxide dehydrogenase medium subunit [Cryptosporangium aurantiacum]